MSTKPKNELINTKIYVLKDPETLEVRYVGKTTKSLISRLGQHIADSKRDKNNHRVNWIRKIVNNGKLPLIEEIDHCPWNESQGMETYYITYYRNQGCDLINETDGGEGNLGHKASSETIAKRKESLRKNLPEVYQYDLNGNFIKKWENAPLAAEKLGFNSCGITKCLRGERFKYKDFIWKNSLVDNAAEELIKNQKERYQRNKIKPISRPQCLLGRIISQEARLLENPYIYVYDLDNNLLYEGISLKDVATFINNKLQRQDIDIYGNISTCLKNNTPYYDLYYFSHNPPDNYINLKTKTLLIISDGEHIFKGVQEASDYFGVKKVNIINNLKNKTKYLTISKEHKVKLTWNLNPEHCRLYVKTYGLSTGELERAAKSEI